MFDFKKAIIRRLYAQIKGGIFTEEAMLEMASSFLKRPLKENQKQLILNTAHKIKNGEMSLEDFSLLIDKKMGWAVSKDTQNRV